MRKLLFNILFILVYFNVFSDQPRTSYSFMSENEQYLLLRESDNGFVDLEKWKLVDMIDSNIIYEIQYESFYNRLSNRTVFISNDGKNIIAIDDYSFAYIDDNKIILSFFNEGIIIKEYTLKDLLNDTDNISMSASHFQWAFENTFNLEDNLFKFMTYELNEYIIDIITGNIIEKNQNSVLSESAIYAYGVVTQSMGNAYNFRIMRLIYGQPKMAVILFRNDLNMNFRNGEYVTLIIKDYVAIYRNDVLFNYKFNFRN